MNPRFIFVILSYLMCGSALAAEPARAQANVPVELTFTAQRSHADPFNDLTLDVRLPRPTKRLRLYLRFGPAAPSGKRAILPGSSVFIAGKAHAVIRVRRACMAWRVLSKSRRIAEAIPCLSTARCAWPLIGGISSTPTARLFSGWG